MTNYRRQSVRCTGRAGGTGATIYRGKQQMNRISLAVLAAGTLALTLVGCGSDDSADASGLRKGTPSSSAPATTKASTSSAAPTSASPSAAITCTQFKSLDSDGEKKAIDQILAANPGGPFENSPNVALSTVKLVCLVPSNADKPVADAAGMKP
ncbi:hypothetical protein [Nocardia alba]|uniref:Uncharacterized protein n=1 Tax=Nocardia alba TaxID=225051 RepID=A0A4R1FYS2_9NOCA|nr:hypothetical protein [Nocardia alba]TCK00358.1 hypothetical protein DFR71_1356 [Nocardia alba]